VVSVRLFWKSLAVQAVVLAVPFVLMALTLERSFFVDWGWLTGPAVWLLASLATARVLSLPLAHALLAALLGGAAGAAVLLMGSHAAGMVAALLVFAAYCAGYEAEADRGDGIRTRDPRRERPVS
jgi:hypothetical protein